MAETIYDYTAKDLAGRDVKLSDYKGKVLLIVNIASQCGFTPQLGGLEQIYEKYKDRGFEVLGFPSNQFGGQEPLEKEQISEFCQVNFGVSFKIMEKSNVRGSEKNDVFKFLTTKKLNGKVGTSPLWNFFKYLVDRDGKVVDYYSSITAPTDDKLTKQIEAALG
jgi:glutathione peroxidase